MGIEVDLLVNYPRTKRNVEERGAEKTDDDRRIARQFGRDFFDGDRRHGYGGFNYFPRFWQPVVPTFSEHFRLGAGRATLCSKATASQRTISVPSMSGPSFEMSTRIGSQRPAR